MCPTAVSLVTKLPAEPEKGSLVPNKLPRSVYPDTFFQHWKTCHFPNVSSNETLLQVTVMEWMFRDIIRRLVPDYSSKPRQFDNWGIWSETAEGWKQRRYAIKIIPLALGSLSQSNALCHFSILVLSKFCLLPDLTEPAVCMFTPTCVLPAELCGQGSNLVFFNIWLNYGSKYWIGLSFLWFPCAHTNLDIFCVINSNRSWIQSLFEITLVSALYAAARGL